MIKLDLVGREFGRWKVLADSGKKSKRNALWVCRCLCGRKALILTSSLQSGHSKSCGCLRRDLGIENNSTHGDCQGRKATRLYRSWGKMKYRCLNPKSKGYHRYGWRGIVVCDAWKEDYAIFRTWALSSGYADNLTIDRIDNDGNYEPSNCQWITRSENSKKARAEKPAPRG